MLLCAVAGAQVGAAAADLTVIVRDAHGAAVSEAVVTLIADRSGPSKIGGAPHVIDQQNEEFRPLVTVVRPGGSIVFKNSDRTLHHVYSFSPTKQFELVVRPGESSRKIAFDQTGVAAIGCNVHDDMITYAVVTDADYAAKTDANGRAMLAGAPEGPATLLVWHPRAKLRGNRLSTPVEVGGRSADVAVTLPLSPDRTQRQSDRY